MAYLHNIKKYDMENSGLNGASVSLWFNHCPHHCPGCWNADTWERQDKLYIDNQEVVREVLEGLAGPMPLNTLALLGGDPLSSKNITDTIEILESIKTVKPNLEVICWTGFRWEQVAKSKILKPVLEYLDVLIDGRFMIDRRIEGKKYGSDNQRCIDVKKSLQYDKVYLMEGF